eukprot:6951236-Pyramimonas_sp.AAC.1
MPTPDPARRQRGGREILLSFKGKISKDHRSRCTSMHNGEDIVMVGPDDKDHDYVELMYTSTFAMVPGAPLNR